MVWINTLENDLITHIWQHTKLVKEILFGYQSVCIYYLGTETGVLWTKYLNTILLMAWTSVSLGHRHPCLWVCGVSSPCLPQRNVSTTCSMLSLTICRWRECMFILTIPQKKYLRSTRANADINVDGYLSISLLYVSMLPRNTFPKDNAVAGFVYLLE